MNIPKEQFDALSRRAEKVIGEETVDRMSDAQLGLLNKALERVLKRHQGDPSSVTSDEIWGQFEMIVDHVLPTGSHEHLL